MFHNNGFENSYEELISYYPAFYRDVLEMRAILEAEGRLLDGCIGAANAMLGNAFVMTANEEMIARLEAFLGIEKDDNRTLEERRSLVYSFYVGFGKLSASKLRASIGAFTDEAVSIKLERIDAEGNNALVVRIPRGKKNVFNFKDTLTVLEKMIPAHIAYAVYFTYSIPVAVSCKHANHIYDMKLCGLEPEAATVCSLQEADTVTETDEAATNYVKSFTPCGTAVAGAL
ncbi:MAG: DUF2313 domain-containing protein [Clostridia bacterium]|nr:DUF2313 domain-containing protein [Clostridia bacterium]